MQQLEFLLDQSDGLLRAIKDFESLKWYLTSCTIFQDISGMNGDKAKQLSTECIARRIQILLFQHLSPIINKWTKKQDFIRSFRTVIAEFSDNEHSVGEEKCNWVEIHKPVHEDVKYHDIPEVEDNHYDLQYDSCDDEETKAYIKRHNDKEEERNGSYYMVCGILVSEMKEAITSYEKLSNLKQRVKERQVILQDILSQLYNYSFRYPDHSCQAITKRYHTHINAIETLGGSTVSIIGGNQGLLMITHNNPLSDDEEDEEPIRKKPRIDSTESLSEKVVKKRNTKHLFETNQFNQLAEILFTDKLGHCWHRAMNELIAVLQRPKRRTHHEILYQIQVLQQNKFINQFNECLDQLGLCQDAFSFVIDYVLEPMLETIPSTVCCHVGFRRFHL